MKGHFVRATLAVARRAAEAKGYMISECTRTNAKVNYLAGETLLFLHLLSDQLAFVMFGWVFVELMEPTKNRITRAKRITLGGFLGTFLSSIVGGYYHAFHRATDLTGAGFEAHLIAMELKRHYLLIGLFLAGLVLFIVWWKGEELMIQKKWRYVSLLLTAILAGVQFVMLTIEAVVVPLGWTT